MEVYKIFAIEAARSLPNLPDGHPCKNIHGHSFKLIITIKGDIQKDRGFVMDIGEIAVRGGIVDIFSPSYNRPIRIDFFGDEVEDLKFFDPLTQLTNDSVKEINILPISEVLLNAINISTFKNNYRKNFGSISTKDELFF